MGVNPPICRSSSSFSPVTCEAMTASGSGRTPQYCSNKNTSSIRDRKKGRKEDKEAVQMAYSSHHQNPERKDMPHGRNDSREWVARQCLPPVQYGIASSNDSPNPDRRPFRDLPA